MGRLADALSVLTVTRGRRELLLDKARSMLRQTLPRERFEWIVVVNGDTDGSADALRELLEEWREPQEDASPGRDLRASVIAFDEALPVGVARNAAAGEASGAWLYFSDDDCLLAPDTLALHAAAQAREPAVWLAPVVFVSERARDRWVPAPRWWQLNGANASVPRAAFAAVDGFDRRLEGYGCEDLLLGYRLHRAGTRVRVLKGAAVIHVGPNPVHGADEAKARSAGRNAAAIAEWHPELAWRLGVHPISMALKRLIYDAPWTPWVERWAGSRVRYERAYFSGAAARRAGAAPTAQSDEEPRRDHDANA